MRQRRRHGSVRVRDDIDREILDRCQSLQIGSCVQKFCRHSVCVCVCLRARLFNVREDSFATPSSSQNINSNSIINLNNNNDSALIRNDNHVVLDIPSGSTNIKSPVVSNNNNSTRNGASRSNSNSYNSNGQHMRRKRWTCHRCTFKNKNLWLRCDMCGDLRRPPQAVSNQ